MEDLKQPAQDLLRNYNQVRWWVLDGPLGAGKTTFVRKFVESAGGDPSQVQSPSYLICLEYELTNGSKVYHMDLFRISDHASLTQLINEYKAVINESKDWIFIEWGSKILPLVDKPAGKISITINNDESRTLTLYLINKP